MNNEQERSTLVALTPRSARLCLFALQRTIITPLLVIVTMTIQAQDNCDSIPESIVDTYWRNEATGDWDIAFTESCAIYDCQLWKCRKVKAKGKGLMLTQDNGRETLGVTIGGSSSVSAARPKAV